MFEKEKLSDLTKVREEKSRVKDMQVNQMNREDAAENQVESKPVLLKFTTESRLWYPVRWAYIITKSLIFLLSAWFVKPSFIWIFKLI